jgi:hypothetical protein
LLRSNPGTKSEPFDQPFAFTKSLSVVGIRQCFSSEGKENANAKGNFQSNGGLVWIMQIEMHTQMYIGSLQYMQLADDPQLVSLISCSIDHNNKRQ